MQRNIIVLVGLIFGLCRLALGAGVEEIVRIYNGEATMPKEVVMGDWGFIPRTDPSRAFVPTKVGQLTYALLLMTAGRYQGARFDLAQPIDSAQLFSVKNTYLELYLSAVPGDKSVGTDPATAPNPMAPGGPQPPVPAPMPGGPPIVPPQPGPGGVIQPPLPGMETSPDANLPAEFRVDPTANIATVPLPLLKNLRFTFVTEKGQGLLTVTPDQFFPKVDTPNGRFIKIDIPLSLLNSSSVVGGKFTRLLITSDEPVQFLVGRIAFVRDVDPLEVKTFIFPPFLEAGKQIFFAARVKAGLSHYETTWNFNTKAGDKIGATGDRVTYTFDTEGNYIISCTVRDLSGGKETTKATVEVRVSPRIGNIGN
ncbi:MAG: PKD domain-containing protein [Armatimonadota bacterium]